MIFKKSALLLFLILSVSVVSYAQEIVQVTMHEAIDMAWENSFESYQNEYNYEMNRLSWLDQKKSLMPSLNISSTLADYNRSIQQQWNSEKQQFLPYEVQRLVNTVNINLYQPVWFTGGTVSVSSGLGRYETFGDNSNALNFISTPIRFSYSQDFNSVNRFKWDQRLGQLRYQEAKKQNAENREQVAIQAISGFYNLLIAQNQLKIAELNASNADSLLWMAREKKAILATSRADYFNLELQQSNARIQLEKAQNEVENQQLSFNIYLGLPLESKVECISAPIEHPVKIDYELAILKVFENNSDLVAIKRRLQEAEISLLEAKRNAFSLSFNASVGLNQNTDNIHNAYQDLLDQQGVGFTFSIPIYDGGNTARNKLRARNTLEYQQKQAEQDKIVLRQEILQRVKDYNITGSQLEAYAKSDTLASYVYQAVRERFILGKASIIDMLDAEERRQNARLSYLRQVQNYWLQYYGIRSLCLYDFKEGTDLTTNKD